MYVLFNNKVKMRSLKYRENIHEIGDMPYIIIIIIMIIIIIIIIMRIVFHQENMSA